MTDCEAFPFDLLPGDYGTTTGHYQRRRDECPRGLVALPSGDQARLLVTYDDVVAALRSRSLSRNLRSPESPRIYAGLDMSANPNLMINLDPPEHTRLRQLVQAAFHLSNVKGWEPAIRHLADRLIDELVAKGPAQDLVTSFARPLAIGVMCDVLGVPSADRQAFTGWSESFFSTSPAEERMASGSEFLRYVRDLIRTCRANPGNGLIDALIAARDNGDRLTEPELRHMISTLFIAGHENTTAALARGVYALARHDQYSELRADQSLAASAVEEILRCEMPSQSALLRVAAADLYLPESEIISAGEAVLACVPAANRDPAHFSDPDAFDIRRDPNPHLSFGAGPHYCVGAALARLELRIALEALTSKLPALRLDCPAEDVRFTTASLIRAPACLPVVW